LVYFADSFLDAATCRRFRSLMDQGTVEAAEILDDTITLDEEVRRVAVIDVPTSALEEVEQQLDAARDKVGHFFGVSLTSREGPSFLRYHKGGFYLPHVDRAVSESWPDAARRQVALVLFLNASAASPGPGEFRGGELCLIEARLDVVPREGLLVAFDAGMLHEVAPVAEGTRDVIVDWFY
jgi:predicted 2-oxoglutarate/Fe(II)-dependent dioxygenase YbiX